jgi:hypothetical protein
VLVRAEGSTSSRQPALQHLHGLNFTIGQVLAPVLINDGLAGGSLCAAGNPIGQNDTQSYRPASRFSRNRRLRFVKRRAGADMP